MKEIVISEIKHLILREQLKSLQITNKNVKSRAAMPQAVRGSPWPFQQAG
jgi:hypothetical protein